MTRENKLALVVGFGLILFVGILVSDHFSAASRQEAADLRPADPADDADPPRDEPGLIDFAPPARRARARMPATELSEVGRAGADQAPVARHEETVRLPDLQNLPAEPARLDLPDREARRLPFSYHDVRDGETLTAVCVRHYGDASLLRELARYNDLDDPDLLTAGRRLVIPPAAELVRGGGAPRQLRPAEPVAPSRAAYERYTIASGDSLTEIAQRHLGSATRWVDLHELNRDVIPDPDHLPVGRTIRIPRSR